MVKYFSLGLWWMSRGNPPLIFLSPCGIERRSYKTHDVIAIDTELPIVERVPTLPFIQKLLPVFSSNFFTVSASVEHYKYYTSALLPC